MKIRLLGSYLISRESNTCESNTCGCSELSLLLSQLPTHCFVQIQLPFEDLSTVVLIYSSDENFNLEEWLYNCYEK